MASRADQELLLSYMQRTGLDDGELAALLEVDRSTLWRLRNAKIQKKTKHLARLEKYLRGKEDVAADDPAQYLSAIAKTSTGLRSVLKALQKLMQENA